jgi:hypothetical protein
MSDREPRLETLIEDMIEARLAGLHTCMPAEVVSFDGSKNSISAQPLLQNSFVDDDGADQIETLPQIDDVPVVFPRGAGGKLSIVWPLEAGDFVVLVFAERSLDRWLSGGGEAVNPADLRKHQLSDPYAIPGGYPFEQAQTPVESDRVAIRYGATEVHVADGKIELGEKDSGDEVPLESKIQDELGKISTQLNQLVSDFNTHTSLDTYISPLIPSTVVPVTPVVPTTPSTVSYNESPTASGLVTIKE